MKELTLTVGIPAYNEEVNIENLLRAILKQKLKSIALKHVYIYSDNSTDRTHEIVKKISKEHRVIKLIEGKIRKGKYYLMNEMFAGCKTDVLIIMDADIAMVGNKFFQTMVSCLTSDPKALVVSARNIFVRPKGFIARVLHAHFMMWDCIMLSIPQFDSASQFSGTATAFKGSYARKLHIPSNVHNPHMFLYLDAKTKKGFHFCTKAEILQYVPSTISEVKTTLVRAIIKPDKVLDRIFGKETIQKLQYVPRRVKLLVIFESFKKDPLYTPFALFMTVYINRLARLAKRSKSQLWEVNTSTKRLIYYEK